MVQTNGGNYASQDVNGKSFQILSDDSLQLMAALKADRVAGFLATHPTWIAGNGGLDVSLPGTPSATPASSSPAEPVGAGQAAGTVGRLSSTVGTHTATGEGRAA